MISNDARRSMPVEALRPLIARPGRRISSAYRSAPVPPMRLGLVGEFPRLLSHRLTDFAETAALIANLDPVDNGRCSRGRTFGRRAGHAGLGDAAPCAGLALDSSTGPYALVPRDASVPPTDPGRLGRGRGTDRAGALTPVIRADATTVSSLAVKRQPEEPLVGARAGSTFFFSATSLRPPVKSFVVFTALTATTIPSRR